MLMACFGVGSSSNPYYTQMGKLTVLIALPLPMPQLPLYG